MPLKFTKPEAAQIRFKGLFYGDWGVGKTTACIQLPRAAYLDLERGTDKYWRTLEAKGSMRLQTTSYFEVLDQIRSLSREAHQFLSLVIDPITIVKQDIGEYWMKVFEKHAKTEKEGEMKDFGLRYYAKVKSDLATLRRALLALDLNIIATAHQKDKWKNGQAVGVTFDGDGEKEGYLFDNIFRVQRENGKMIAYTEKQREEKDAPKFPASFEWSYEELCRLIGKDVLERPSKPIPLASIEQVSDIKKLMELFSKIDPEFETKVFAKYKIDNWEELLTDPADQVMAYIKKQMGGK